MNIKFFVTCFFKTWQFWALCSSQIKRLIIPKCTKKFYVQKVFIKKNPFRLSKWSNYPSNIGKEILSKNLFVILTKFSSICEILAMFKTNSMALKYLRRIRQIKVFGFFHGYFVNTDLFCHFYTSIND